MATRLRNEPALLIGFLQALLAFAVSFGLDLSPEQIGSIVALTAAATAVFLRQQVSPVPAGSGQLTPTAAPRAPVDALTTGPVAG